MAPADARDFRATAFPPPKGGEHGGLLNGGADLSSKRPEALSEGDCDEVALPSRQVTWTRRVAVFGLFAVVASVRLGQNFAVRGGPPHTQALTFIGQDESSSCKDAEPGERCFEAVAWVMQSGIYEHPEWFEGLNQESRFEEVQAQLYESDSSKKEDEKSHCARPCTDVSVEKRHKGIPGSALDLPIPGPFQERATLEFYVYRSQGWADYPLENVNAADLAGVMWYLHNEIVVSVGETRKYDITRIKRFKVKMVTSWAYYNSHRRQFGSFVAFDSGSCTVPNCERIWTRFGALPGCQLVDAERDRAAYMSDVQTYFGDDCEGYRCKLPIWFSFPGPCPQQENDHKTSECKDEYPSGLCDSATGERDCTYSIEDAGWVGLDKVTGIENYATFFKEGGIEYSFNKDHGEHCSFWDERNDEIRGQSRVQWVKKLFDDKYPDMAKCDELPTPQCDTDGYYPSELQSTLSDWPVYEEGPLEHGAFGDMQEQSTEKRTTARATTTTSPMAGATNSTSALPVSPSRPAQPSRSKAPASKGTMAKATPPAQGKDGATPTSTIPANRSFTVVLDRSGEEALGLEFTMEKDVIIVDAITGGLLERWNNEHTDQQVRPGDHILSVSDVHGGADQLADELEKSRVLKLEVQAFDSSHSSAPPPGLLPWLIVRLVPLLVCAPRLCLSGLC